MINEGVHGASGCNPSEVWEGYDEGLASIPERSKDGMSASLG